MSKRAVWALVALIALAVLTSATLLRSRQTCEVGVLHQALNDLQQRYFEARLLEGGSETGVVVRYAPRGALEVDFSRSTYDMPRFFRIVGGHVYVTNLLGLGGIDLRTGEVRLYLAIFSLYDPRILLPSLEGCHVEESGTTTIISGEISEELLSSFDLPEKEARALENLFGGAIVTATLEGNTLVRLEISSQGVGSIALDFSYSTEPLSIEAPTPVMVIESESDMDRLWEGESASMANADLLIAVLNSYKEEHGCYPQELNKSVADELGMDWPTNPFFDRPVQNVTSPGDFGYVRVNCNDCFLKVYGWDSVVRIWFPPRG